MNTESLDPDFVDLAAWPIDIALARLLDSQRQTIDNLQTCLGPLAVLIEAAGAGLRKNGRIIYIGAGTSARIAMQDASELFPTFTWPHDRAICVLAGGKQALIRAQENAEDNEQSARDQLKALNITPDDLIVGISASGSTPFVIAGIQFAKDRGATCAVITNDEAAPLCHDIAHVLATHSTPEAIAGSTRMKSGTAQKVVLNLLSTMLMVQLGRVYKGHMVQMRPTNAKLRKRACEIVAKLGNTDQAARLLKSTDDDIQLAIMLAHDVDIAVAKSLLRTHHNNLALALAAL